MHCPLCSEKVLKVKELPIEEYNETRAKCVSEYWVHKGNKLYKIINPITPTDLDRKKYENI